MDLKIGIDIRKDVLLSALYVEGYVSHFLARLLNVKDPDKSMSFGHTGKALSFNQKVNLLIDVGALKKEDQTKFITFMEIRNQFMHNMNAKTYELCFSYIKGKDKFLLGMYPQKATLSPEKQLEKAVSELTNEVTKLSISVIDKIADKGGQEAKAAMYKDLFEILKESIVEGTKTIDNISEEIIKKGGTVSSKTLSGLGKTVSQIIFQTAKKKLNEKNSSS
ncbi:MAG: hypothetical protein Q8M29_02070 [Bacteroidota bacterium]|nr:hypothetical protein [Bacteroidota bacterium]